MADPITSARIQLRWEVLPYDYGWKCHYELILPLGEFDVRREDRRGRKIRDHLVIKLCKSTTTRQGGRTPCDASGWMGPGARYFDPPYRDGAHAAWDAALLGNIPIVCIAPDGTVIPKPAEGEE